MDFTLSLFLAAVGVSETIILGSIVDDTEYRETSPRTGNATRTSIGTAVQAVEREIENEQSNRERETEMVRANKELVSGRRYVGGLRSAAPRWHYWIRHIFSRDRVYRVHDRIRMHTRV